MDGPAKAWTFLQIVIRLYKTYGNTMPVKPSIELILHDEVQKLLDLFSAVLKARIVFYAPDGKIIRSNRQHRNSEYCRLIQENIFNPDICASLDAAKQAECLTRKSLVCYQCHAGLKEAVAPVLIDGRLAGFVMIGQFRDISGVPAHVIRRCRGRAAVSRLKRAFSSLPYIAAVELNDILGMFMMLVDYIVARELVGLRGNWVVEKVGQYIDRHFAEKVKIEDVAKFTGRSVSSLSHLLRKKYGFTFKQMLIEKRLSQADGLLKSRPELSMGEIAGRSGFDDRFYFSRIYRKYRKKTPTQSRSQFFQTKTVLEGGLG
ncbi:MAG: PocR ligand-binding domain-containing protein [Victivallales bacterium]